MAAGKYQRRDGAFPRVRGVLGIDQADDGGECVLGVGAAALRHFSGGGEPAGGGFGSGHGDNAQLGERGDQRLVQSRRRQ